MFDSGFVFVELYTSNLKTYIAFFEDVGGFRLIRDEGDFAELRSHSAVILLNADAQLPDGHPFRGWPSSRIAGMGVEIGIVLDDLPRARERAVRFAGWTVSPLVTQDWGLTDFRVTTPDGYYLRFTEPFR